MDLPRVFYIVFLVEVATAYLPWKGMRLLHVYNAYREKLPKKIGIYLNSLEGKGKILPVLHGFGWYSTHRNKSYNIIYKYTGAQKLYGIDNRILCMCTYLHIDLSAVNVCTIRIQLS